MRPLSLFPLYTGNVRPGRPLHLETVIAVIAESISKEAQRISS
jgi:hypothetical protein